MTKAEHRKVYLERRGLLSQHDVASMSRAISDRFFVSIDLTRIEYLHTFIRITKFREIDTSMIYNGLWCDCPHIQTFAPRSSLAGGEIECVGFDGESKLRENPWGIREPVGGEVIGAERIDLVIVPLLCFDESGHRVGYGKGIYDRFLARCRTDCLKVGFSYFPPVAAIDEVSETDIRLDVCITPEHVYKH